MPARLRAGAAQPRGENDHPPEWASSAQGFLVAGPDPGEASVHKQPTPHRGRNENRTMKLKTILATAVVTAAACFAATGASAADKADTHVSFVSATPHGGDYWYEGYIDSTKQCADNRKVKVFRIANGPDIKIGV